MSGMFKVLGVLVALYVAQSIWKGEVYAKKGAWGETVRRDDSPKYFWTIIVIYSLLSLALLTIF